MTVTVHAAAPAPIPSSAFRPEIKRTITPRWWAGFASMSAVDQPAMKEATMGASLSAAAT
jgi:hypothetical protein